MRIVILGAGPAGLYAGLLIKKADPRHDVTVIERNPADVTYGWGVVFSDRTLMSFQRADYKTYQQITGRFVIWDAIDVRYRGETIRCGGHVIASISRKELLNILQTRCRELGVDLRFGVDIGDLSQLPEYDLLIAADGVNSLIRKTFEEKFRPSIELGKAKYIWLGADKVLDAFNFIFHTTEHGLFQVHAYPFSGTTSTFIVECAEDTWLKAGLDRASAQESVAFCQDLLSDDLQGAALLSNNSKWISFPTLKTRHWHIWPEGSAPIVLLGDAVHTAHFSIGSGTKLAMEDAIALAGALEQHAGLETALNEYELERKPVVETFQRAAEESRVYFETLNRYLKLPPVQFAFQLLTRSGRITYDDLRFRDVRFGDMVDRWFNSHTTTPGPPERPEKEAERPLFAPSPLFAPLSLRDETLRNRLVVSPPDWFCANAPGDHGPQLAGVAGLTLTSLCAVSPQGRITPEDSGIYTDQQVQTWKRVVNSVHAAGGEIGVQIGHAGRRGATRPRAAGRDRPLLEGAWPLLSASAIPYTRGSQVPRAMDRDDMDRVRDDFVQAAHRAAEAGFDLLSVYAAHGYLLSSFLSPLTNLRTDEYGGSLANRMRFPLEVVSAVRAVLADDKPLMVAINASDCVRGGWEVEDSVAFARELKAVGCDLIMVHAGQITPESEPTYGRGFLTHYSDRVRNEACIPTLVGGYLTNSNDVNTILAAGRADLCLVDLL